MVILLGVVYLVVGITSSTLAGGAATDQMRLTWRLLAYFTSAVAFAAHIGYEHFRLRNTPFITAWHTSMAVALGAFALAVAANVHGLFVSSNHQSSHVLALLAFPAVTAIPAFVVALTIAAALALRQRSK